MFFLFSKLLSFLINPGIWLIALLLYAWLGKVEYLKTRVFKTALVVLLVFSNPFLFYEALRLWEIPAVALNSLDIYDAGIVLGTVAKYDSTLDRTQFERGSDRLFQGVELYEKGKIKRIMYSGGSGSVLHQNEKDGLFIKQFLITIGIPEKDVFIENESHNTHENAAFAKSILASFAPNGRYLLITSAYHMRRSLACFKKEGIQVDPYCVDLTVRHKKIDLNDFIVPDITILDDWYALFHELTGYMSYKIAGYI